MEWLPLILYAAAHSAVPLLIAGLGELITEKSGVLNLGVEGLMLVGAVFAFIVAHESGSVVLGLTAAAFAGALMALFFALLTVGLRANQVACGLALTIFGAGFSAFVGLDYEGKTLTAFSIGEDSVLSFLAHDKLAHNLALLFGIVMLFLTWRFLNHSRAGLILRACGENHDAAKRMGYRVSIIRAAAVVYGGVMCALAGAYLSIVYTPLWAQDMTAGRGWIVLALVVFASWRPLRLLAGAMLFGFVGILNFSLQNWGVNVSPQFLAMAPYLATIAALTLISWKLKNRRGGDFPSCIGKPLPISG